MAVRPLPPDLMEVALRDVNEDPKRTEEDLKYIREWLSKQPHLISRTDSQWLTSFLRGCKFSLERTKEKLEMFYTLRTAVPEFFKNRDPLLPELQHIFKLGCLVPLPEPDEHGRRVMLMRNGLVDLDKVKVEDIIKTNLMIMDLLLKDDDRAVICGTVSLMDMSGSKLSDLGHFSPSLMKKMSTIFQDGYPIRPKAMHHFNINAAFTAMYNMMKPFFKDKMQRRIHVHQNIESVCEIVPKRLLPQEYGGDLGPLQTYIDECFQKLVANRSWFLEDEKYRSDEKKRIGKPKTQEDLFGLEGSFRRLNVD